jgi:hypothetical protein
MLMGPWFSIRISTQQWALLSGLVGSGVGFLVHDPRISLELMTYLLCYPASSECLRLQSEIKQRLTSSGEHGHEKLRSPLYGPPRRKDRSSFLSSSFTLHLLSFKPIFCSIAGSQNAAVIAASQLPSSGSQNKGMRVSTAERLVSIAPGLPHIGLSVVKSACRKPSLASCSLA